MSENIKKETRTNEQIGVEAFNSISDTISDYQKLVKENPRQAMFLKQALGEFAENNSTSDTLRFQEKWIYLIKNMIRLENFSSVPINDANLNSDTYYFLTSQGTLSIRTDQMVTRHNDNGSITDLYPQSETIRVSRTHYLDMERYATELKEKYDSLKEGLNQPPFEKA